MGAFLFLNQTRPWIPIVTDCIVPDCIVPDCIVPDCIVTDCRHLHALVHHSFTQPVIGLHNQ